MTRQESWEEYLTRLCLERWSLEPASTIQLMARIESLLAPGSVSDSEVATVLRRAGVNPFEAISVAPHLRTALCA